jgi:hypothetical protein
MTQPVRERSVFLFLSALIIGCGNDPSFSSPADGAIHPDSRQNNDLSIVKPPIAKKEAPHIWGDWFYCKDKDCKRLSYFGMRFSKDGTVTNLYASTPEFTPGEAYCYLSHPNFVGEYVWTGKEVLADMPKAKRTMTLPFVIKNDRVNISPPNIPPQYLRHVPSSSSQDPCKDRIPWVCPAFEPEEVRRGSGGKIFYSSGWTCDNGYFSLACNRPKEQNTYICACKQQKIDDNRMQDHYYQVEINGGPPTGETFIKMANKVCGWNIWMPLMFEGGE